LVLIDTSAKNVYVSLIIRSRNLDPVLISRELEIPEKMSQQGHPDADLANYGYWILQSDHFVQSTDLTKHVNLLLDFMDQKRTILESYQQHEHKFEMSCYWLGNCSNTCLELDSDVILRLASWKIGIWFDVYMHPEN